MENEIVQALKNIESAINNKYIFWANIFSALACIIIPGITIWLTCYMHKQNKNLQKYIHNRDIRIQYRNDILYIYNAFINAIKCITKSEDIAYIFSRESRYKIWCNNIIDAETKIQDAYNRAIVIFDDIDLINSLMSFCNNYNDIVSCIKQYIIHNEPLFTIRIAEDRILREKLDMSNDPSIFDKQFAKLCENSKTMEIETKIKSFLATFNSDYFVEKFKKYIVLSEIR